MPIKQLTLKHSITVAVRKKDYYEIQEALTEITQKVSVAALSSKNELPISIVE